MNLDTAETALSKPQSLFYNPNFVLLFSGKIISQLGDQIYAFALAWYVLDITKSSLLMSVILVINALVFALVSPFGGIIADRLNRKNIMVWMDVARGIIVLVAAFLLYHHLLQVWMIYVSAIALSFCGAIFSPSASAVIPNIVSEDQLTRAVSRDQFVGSFCSITGMLIGGILYNLIGIMGIFLLNAVSFFLSGILEACLKILSVKKIGSNTNSSVFREFNKAMKELNEGYQYVKQNKLVFYLTIMCALFNLIAMPLGMVFIPYIFNVILKATALQLSLSLGSTWIGSSLGVFLIPLFLNRYKLKDAIFGGYLTCSICWILIPSLMFTPLKGFLNLNNWDITVIFIVVSFFIGLALTSSNIPMGVIFQKHTVDEYRGRFWGLQTALIAFTMAVGYFAGGFVAQKVPMGILFFSASIITLFINLWVINLKEIKELKD